MDLMAVYNIVSHYYLEVIVAVTHHGYEIHKDLLRQVANKIFLKYFKIFLTVAHIVTEQVSPIV
jgi:hypothetical protein